jgi:molybdopterin-guanine dinucleotide biosynthesis protein A
LSSAERVRLAGLILAGGRSRRFGADKARAVLGGRPLIAWSLAVLRPHVEVIALSGPDALAAEIGLAAVADPDQPGRGPLAGVIAGLGWASGVGATHLATAPCDTPFLPQELAPRLVAGLDGRAVVAARAERVHALCAVWSVRAAADLAGLAQAEKQLSMQAIMEALGGGYVDFPDEAAFANVNTPEDMAAAQARIAATAR